jgi:hypothetical protein
MGRLDALSAISVEQQNYPQRQHIQSVIQNTVTEVGTSSWARNAQETTLERLDCENGLTVSRFKLEFSRFQKRSCTAFCGCNCHNRARYRTTSFTNRLLGKLFLGYNSLPLVGTKCSEPSCSQRSPFSATITYYFPTWLIARMISLILITTTTGDPAACIKIRPINFDFSIFHFSSEGNTAGAKSIIRHRTAHPSGPYRGYVAVIIPKTYYCANDVVAGRLYM